LYRNLEIPIQARSNFAILISDYLPLRDKPCQTPCGIVGE